MPEFDSEQDRQFVIMPDGPGLAYQCPCCRYRTLNGRGGYEICPVCFWEDDGQDDHDADQVYNGPNRNLSLTQARRNYREHGVADLRDASHVRPPTAEETAPD